MRATPKEVTRDGARVQEVQLGMTITPELRKAIRVRAAEEDTTMHALVMRWIEAGLKR
jgi:hypothetical protein